VAQGRPPSRRRQETRDRLLAAARGVFAERGVGRTSIEDVCAAAGFTRGAFYSNFADLDELFLAVYAEQSALTARRVGEVLAAAAPDRSVAELVDDVVAALAVDRDWLLVRTEFLLHAARVPALRESLAAHRDAVAAELVPVLSGVAATLPAGLRAPGRLARVVMSVHDGVSLELLLDPDPAVFRRSLRELLVLLLDHT
jgi:AcrR family transcriptional regulator